MEQIIINSKKYGTQTTLVGLNKQPLILKKSKLYEIINEKNISHNVHQAIKLSRKIILEDYYSNDIKHKSTSERLVMKNFDIK